MTFAIGSIDALMHSLNIIESYGDDGRHMHTTWTMKEPLYRSTSHCTIILTRFSHWSMRFMYVCIHTCIYIVGIKQSRKIYVPVKEHPEINYLGLLIGPQGSTQKQLSASTGARIVIRGRGSNSNSNGNSRD